MEAPEESIVNLVKKLMYFESEVFNLRRAVDSMEELSARLYGLPDAADLRLIENSSRYVTLILLLCMLVQSNLSRDNPKSLA